MASSIEICNDALTMLSQEPVMALDDTTKASRLCKQRYEPVRDALLRSYPWSFAMKREILARDLESPAFGYANAYSLPVDCVRVVSINDRTQEWQVEGRKVLTNADRVNLRYIRKVEDPNEMDAMFRECLTLKLAADMCMSLTSNIDLKSMYEQLLERKINLAYNASAIESTPPEVIEGNWILSRY